MNSYQISIFRLKDMEVTCLMESASVLEDAMAHLFGLTGPVYCVELDNFCFLNKSNRNNKKSLIMVVEGGAKEMGKGDKLSAKESIKLICQEKERTEEREVEC